MKQVTTIYKQGKHRWLMVARDPSRPEYLIDTNEYLIMHGNDVMLTDPGGTEIFPAVFSAICKELDPGNIKSIFASHQDPDIISSIGLWLEVNPAIKCHLSWLWASFVPHFGGNDQTFHAIADEGGSLLLDNSLKLEFIPAHYLHSSGNFHLYDRKARILFSGDVGAALIPPDKDYLFVEDFDQHMRYAEGFHRRWMGSNEAKQRWCQRVRDLDIDMLCPQHGAIYRGEQVQRFIDWFERLEVGKAA